MWEVENRSPFPHRGGFLRDAGARTFWCLHLKASFALRPTLGPQFLPQQPDLRQAPDYDGERLIGEAEIGHARAQCDLILAGTAYAPPEARAERGWVLEARLGGWRKALHVRPSQVWEGKRPRLTDAPLAPVVLDWRAAYGGDGVAENPLGVGVSPIEGGALPRLTAEGIAIDHPAPPPACFAPIPRDWPQRARWGGRYDAEWSRRRAPLLPEDLDPRYWQSTAPDQWLSSDTLAGETLHLSGFSANPQAIVIPDCAFEIATRFRGKWHQQTPHLQSATVDLDRQSLSLVWLAAFPIEAAQNDVLVERSFIALRGSRGFTVAAPDMPNFTTPWEAQ